MNAESLKPLQPYDIHNQRLESNVRPRNWKNPPPRGPYQLVVIGAGTAGLVAAAAAAGLGARVALIERELMGGDCLNVGCVPSKAVIAAARDVAARWRVASGEIPSPPDEAAFTTVMERMRKLRADISPNDSAERFRALGVDVFFGQGSFVDRSTIEVRTRLGEEIRVSFRKAVVATGARAAAPPIPGLERVPYLTNESLFSLTVRPPCLGVIGAGPIGCEMAQAFAQLGSEVTLFETASRILANEDDEASAIVQAAFDRLGIQTICGSERQRLAPADGGRITITGHAGNRPYDVLVDQVLVAVGRAPNVEGLGLDKAGVTFDAKGVRVNDFLQTTNKNIYAAGDICSRLKLTHAADFQARIVVQNALFAVGPVGRKRASRLTVPWSTYTSPEIAHVGMYEKDAAEKGMAIDSYVQHLADVDRAILDGSSEGFVKVHVRKGTDRIVGATIVARNAGDLISELTLAMRNNIGLAAIGATIHPYPTQAEAIRRLGDQFNRTRLTRRAQWLLRGLSRWNAGS
jgi:pyruvate/2-oxoglutarate dehydrogenase complex dihydrolipoamide dehydrogenase (E3) component